MYLGLVLHADQQMENSGIGDYEAWSRFNNFAGIAFNALVFVWLATIVLSLACRVFASPQAQRAIGLPPLALAVDFFWLW